MERPFQINVKNIDTSVGFGFYIKNKTDYEEFRNHLQNSIKNDPNFLIGIESTTPTIEFDPEDMVEYQNDDSFEIIG